MQLLTIALHHHDGRRRLVDFKPGRLNILTGESKTGKSALLTIVDYCFGNNDAQVPRSSHFDSVSWFSTLWQLPDGSRIVLARPSALLGLARNSAMLLRGGASLGIPDSSALTSNTDSASMRTSVSELIGLGDVLLAPSEHSSRSAFTVGLGTAALFCLQMQDEIANRENLFHRQGTSGKQLVLQDTLPFFLGAVEGDQAAKVAELRQARRTLREHEAALQVATVAAERVSADLQSLLSQAFLAGLVPVDRAGSTQAAIEILQGVLATRPDERSAAGDVLAQDARASLERERSRLREQLRDIMFDRELVLVESVGASEFSGALALQIGRLSSLELLPHVEADEEHAGTCPVCHSTLNEPDPVASAIDARLRSLRLELADTIAAQPASTEALERLSGAARGARERLRVLDGAFDGLATSSPDTISDSENADFVRGRIDVVLGQLPSSSEAGLLRLTAERDAAARRVEMLREELDSDASRDLLTSRLSTIGRDMTDMAMQLDLEHAEAGARLDIRGVRAVIDLDSGPTPLTGIGSAANWIGYHLVAHLALHKLFARHNRPVPRFLMLDQPTQAFYQSQQKENVEVAESESEDHPQPERIAEPASAPEPVTESSADEKYADREAVRRMFRLLHDYVEDLNGDIQVIVVDHADEDDPWFAESVVHVWRGGEKLVPEDWLSHSAETANGRL